MLKKLIHYICRRGPRVHVWVGAVTVDISDSITRKA